MNATAQAGSPQHEPAALLEFYLRVRATTADLCRTLTPEDHVIQSMPDVSPAKWHLAHTSWFFENFLLAPHLPGYEVFHPRFGYLFNSYYYTVGRMHPRPQRGLLSRPTVAETMAYRGHVDEAMRRLLESRAGDADIARLTVLGANHEQQHQELLLTDIKHVFAQNPLMPAWRELAAPDPGDGEMMKFIPRAGGLIEIGMQGEGFCFDNELPRHPVYMAAHELASRPVSNAEFAEFIRAGGYSTPELWLSDGWATIQREGWQRPLYWEQSLAAEFTLSGLRELDPAAPVVHVSYYEADAFARWAGARLATEAEWETAARELPMEGNLMEAGAFHPRAGAGTGLRQMFGDVWEWTASPYVNYPGYRPPAGAIGEYNGKFMCNQLVLRGGSCATPATHIRASYRNFFYPDSRWQFTGIRLAKDA